MTIIATPSTCKRPRTRTVTIRLCPVTGREIKKVSNAKDLGSDPRLDHRSRHGRLENRPEPCAEDVADDIRRDCRGGYDADGVWLEYRDLESVEQGLHWRSRESECATLHEWRVRDLCDQLNAAGLARYVDTDVGYEVQWLSEEEEAKVLREHQVEVEVKPRPRKLPRPRVRRTKRSWMKEDKYSLSFDGATANAMEISERMCKSKRWDAAVLAAGGPAMGGRPAVHLWKRTMQSRATPWGNGIRIRRSKNRDGGQGGPKHGVSVTFSCRPSPGEVLMTLLHEITHFVHLTCMKASVVNGKRRPHDLAFNVIQYRMARSFWGYDTEPHAAGWSVGRGYAPSRHLCSWIDQQFKAGNPKVLSWFQQVQP